MAKIYALVDYQGYFESKYDANPYLSGMDKAKLRDYFSEAGYEITFIGFSEVGDYQSDFWEGKIFIYTSSEDTGLHYKSFVEDIMYYLELCHAIVIPSFKYLKANNNKVFMELLRNQMNTKGVLNIRSRVFGSLEEAKVDIENVQYPVVFKKSSGAMSKGVGSALNYNGLIKNLKVISRTRYLFKEMWENGRAIKYKNYKKESLYRNKFVLQNFIADLSGDYKILVFSDNYYALKRGLKANDFRASGSGIRIFDKNIPEGLLSFASDIYKELRVPNASIDIAFDGNQFYLVEFQCIYFGSFTLTFSDFYWRKYGNKFLFTEEKSELERVYSSSIINFIRSL